VQGRVCCDDTKVCHSVETCHFVQLRYLHCNLTCNVFVRTDRRLYIAIDDNIFFKFRDE